MRRWGRRFFESTRGRVVLLLRTGEASVSDLAGELDLTDNAVRSHLNTLERDGLVRPSGRRAGVRKPETLYALTTEADSLFPEAYHLLFNRLLDQIEVRMTDDEVEALLREIGAALATELVERRASSFQERAEDALDALERIGGLADIEEKNGEYVIQGHSCPLSKAVAEHPRACRLAEALLSAILQAPVTERCDRSGTPKCAFRVEKS